MRFAQVLAFAGVALAGHPVYVTEVVTETSVSPVKSTTTTPTATWHTYTEIVTVTLGPETTISVPINSTTAWSNGTHPAPTGKKPSGGDKPGHTEVPVVTAGAASSKASFAGLLGLAGAAMLIL